MKSLLLNSRYIIETYERFFENGLSLFFNCRQIKEIRYFIPFERIKKR
jgi:hypothetical protein